MALVQSVTLVNGVVGEYWTIDRIDIDIVNSRSLAYMSLYKDQDSFTNGFNPILKQTVLFDAAKGVIPSNVGILDPQAAAITDPTQRAAFIAQQALVNAQTPPGPIPPYAFSSDALGIDFDSIVSSQLVQVGQFTGAQTIAPAQSVLKLER